MKQAKYTITITGQTLPYSGKDETLKTLFEQSIRLRNVDEVLENSWHYEIKLTQFDVEDKET